MSGTSLDGIDLAYVNFKHTDRWSFSIIKAETVPYTKHWKRQLQEAVNFSEAQLTILDTDYTTYLSQVITAFIENNSISKIDAVSSHGHTILHQPDKGFTLQIGNLPELAKRINQTVVCDFRVQDVALGGQGAPLVPIGDGLLFPDYDYCLNLGGFANISTEKNSRRRAYDICPVNTVLNYYAEQLGLDYDDGGKVASKSNVNLELLQQLNALDFYQKQPPKSLGIEWVYSVIIPLINSFKISAEDSIATFTEHCGFQISKAIGSENNSAKVLVTGGGAFNTFLIKRVSHLSTAIFKIPNTQVINYKEALIFGLLGVLKLRDETNVLASVTGASKNHSSGKIFHP